MTPGDNGFFQHEGREAAAQVEVAVAAFRFLGAVYGDDRVQAWVLMHPVLRLCWAQAWVEPNREGLISVGMILRPPLMFWRRALLVVMSFGSISRV